MQSTLFGIGLVLLPQADLGARFCTSPRPEGLGAPRI